MEQLPLLASLLPEVRENLEGKQALCTVCKGVGFLGEQGVCSSGYRVYCVLWGGRCIFTSLLKCTFL